MHTPLRSERYSARLDRMRKENKFWAQIICDLEEEGYSVGDIASMVKLAPGSVSDIKCGRTKEPRGEAAVLLYKQHERMERKSA